MRRDLPTQLQIALGNLRAHIDRKGRGSLSETEQLLWYCGEALDRAIFERVQTEKLALADIETATQKAERNEVDYLQARTQLENWVTVAAKHGAPTNPLLFAGWLASLLEKNAHLNQSVNHLSGKTAPEDTHLVQCFLDSEQNETTHVS